MGHNISPEGGVSAELLASQVKARPASTLAPEAFLEKAVQHLDRVFRRKWGKSLFRLHKDTSEIVRKASRFRSTDLPSLLALAKDLARLTADSIDVESLHAIVPLEKSETRRGSLKSLERVLGTLVSADEARRIMGPLFGVYNLRVGDAHLASSEIDNEFCLVGIDRSATPLEQGFQLLFGTVEAIFAIAHIVETSTSPTSSGEK
jgi:hypothetical protein